MTVLGASTEYGEFLGEVAVDEGEEAEDGREDVGDEGFDDGGECCGDARNQSSVSDGVFVCCGKKEACCEWCWSGANGTLMRIPT